MKKLNNMCETCARLGKDCDGTTCQIWTGCVYYQEDKEKKSLHFTRATFLDLSTQTHTEYVLIVFNMFAVFQKLTP